MAECSSRLSTCDPVPDEQQGTVPPAEAHISIPLLLTPDSRQIRKNHIWADDASVTFAIYFSIIVYFSGVHMVVVSAHCALLVARCVTTSLTSLTLVALS